MLPRPAVLDKQQRQRVFRKSVPSDLFRDFDTGFAIRMRAKSRVRCVNYWQKPWN